MEQPTQSRRIAGLDLLRASAIVLVLLAHYPKTGTGPLIRLLNFGWTGVDLFFILSGYLIAGQLFASLSSGKEISITAFYLRRLLRTLPNYYVILAAYVILSGFTGAASPAPLWKFAAFVQNFGIPSTFAPSWSLCVEEQFYLIFPLIVVLAARSRSSKIAISTFAGILILEIAIRSGIWFVTRPDLLPETEALTTYMAQLYYPTYCRLDGITLGVGLAALKYFRPVIWQQLMARGNYVFAGSCVFLLASVLVLWKHYSFLCSTLGFTLLGISFVLLTASVLSDNWLLARWQLPGVQYIALLSYSIYLTHSLALECSSWLAARAGISLQSPLGVGIAGILILVFANLLYHLVERPFMTLRDRIFGTSKTRRRTEALMPAAEAQ
jgi:peptidoglycan/LPS O-acetylase OafA/YrhL